MPAENEKTPLYLALSCTATDNLKRDNFEKFEEIIQKTWKILKIEFRENDSFFQKDFESISEIAKIENYLDTAWSAPEKLHMFQLIMMNRSYLKSKIYDKFKENTSAPLRVPAVLYIPGHVLTALCFPSPPTKTLKGPKFPHINLAIKPPWKSY